MPRSLTGDSLQHYLETRHGSPVTIEEVRELGGDATGSTALKQFGYGRPLLVVYRVGERKLEEVFHRLRRNSFGRERYDDRVAAIWLDYHTFNRLPRHVPAIDMIGYRAGGTIDSLGNVEEFLLVTGFRPGTLYADDLLRIRDEGKGTAQDVTRAEALAGYLAGIHQQRYDDDTWEEGRQALWRRRLRDLIGHGECIMGLTDSYPLPLPYVDAEMLRAIEEAANRWRWRLKPLDHRLCQVHGDFHPFNILFTEDVTLTLLDRSRGEWGEAADDVSCLSINYLFFSLQRAEALEPPFKALHQRFWERYLELRPDEEMLSAIQPWFAWRALVLASPIWYPDIREQTRRRLFTFARRVLESERYEWRDVNQYLEVE